MPGQRAADKTTLSVTISRPLMKRLKKWAKSKGLSVTDVVLKLVAWEVRNVELTSVEYAQIAKETKEAEERK